MVTTGFSRRMNYFYSSNESRKITLVFSFKSFLKLEPISVLFVITVFTVFRLLTDFVCLYTYEFWLSVCKIVRSSIILLLPLYITQKTKPWEIRCSGGVGSSCFINYMLLINDTHIIWHDNRVVQQYSTFGPTSVWCG